MSELWVGAAIGAIVSIPGAIIFGYIVNLTTPALQRVLSKRSDKALLALQEENAIDRGLADYLSTRPAVASMVQRMMLRRITVLFSVWALLVAGAYSLGFLIITQSLLFDPTAPLYVKIILPTTVIVMVVIAIRNVVLFMKLRPRYKYMARYLNEHYPFDIDFLDNDAIVRYGGKKPLPPTDP